jgi:hypothetical protein
LHALQLNKDLKLFITYSYFHDRVGDLWEIASADTLLGDVKTAGGRAERLYNAAEGILGRALEAEDLKTALTAIGTAVDVMREARGDLEFRGKLTSAIEDKEQRETVQIALVRLPSLGPPESRD